ncbi:MAG: hypothetical protein JO104_02080, partial [Candidatus Eremiobacteraeota bacterium]|nr:hypothetical protein [Candidatus Eremiobacteraeota bacterium]
MPARSAVRTEAPSGESKDQGDTGRDARSEDLLYVAAAPFIRVLTYPGGKLVGSINQGMSLEGMCADRNGNV